MRHRISFRTAGLFVILMLVLGQSTARGETFSVKKAAFAAGCFWGVEKILGELPGVVSTRVGYSGGRTKNPSYEEVCSGRTGHAEAVEISYDPAKISYEELLLTFWQYHDPTTRDRQGPDIGSQYRSVVFYHDAEQRTAAERSVKLLEKARVFKNPIVTEIVPAAGFYAAEEYHQKYLKKNPKGYCSHHLQSHRIAEVLGPTLPRMAEG
jgi:peptide-methionine (S)-S-oxide reductase